MRYPTVDELVFINARLLNNAKMLRGEQQIRDMALLEAAVARPAQSAFGADAYPSPALKAAALLHSVARNHPFADGNKRTATLGALFLLGVNGWQATWDAPVALGHILALAQGAQTAEVFAAWLPLHPAAPLPTPDADADTARIAVLMQEHAWLLDELATR